MVAYSVLPLPAGAIALVNGMLFGPVVGTTVTWIGAMAGAVLAYGVARWLGKAAVVRLVPVRFRSRLDQWTRCVGSGELLVVRLIPVISFTLLNYSAGLAGVRPWIFLWTTALGILPLTVVSVLIGHGALTWSPGVWLTAVLGAVAILLVVRRLAGNLSRQPTNQN
ncbi:VTT domain-containing protein [Aquisalimonas lutea]|nr:VTT domain-containing protein [Aquisalimonas lutea]MDN3519071.1 VTT domain-containing protein [Aquisalimonas lutea]